MKIVALQSENVKRLKAVEVRPDRPLVTIGGANASGKTSLLDSIEMALGGKGSVPAQPVRKGEASARVVCDLGDVIVERTFTPDGKTALKVKSKEGALFPSPQSMLDKLVGQLSFDPLAFTKLDTRRRADLLCELVGLDMSEFASKRSALYNDRAILNRDIKQASARVEDMPRYDGAPEQEVSVAELVAELEAARKHEQFTTNASAHARTAEAAAAKSTADAERLEMEAARALNRAQEFRASAAAELEARARHLARVEELKATAPDAAAITDRLNQSEATNKKVRANAARLFAMVDMNETKAAADHLTKEIEAVDAEKLAAIAAAQFPITGLSVSDDGVLFNGIPFEQASGAEQLRVSAAIGVAMHPKLRVLLIRDGSLLDNDGLRLLAEFAAEQDVQIWLEKVTDDRGACTVLIEDGAIAAEEAEAAQ